MRRASEDPQAQTLAIVVVGAIVVFALFVATKRHLTNAATRTVEHKVQRAIVRVAGDEQLAVFATFDRGVEQLLIDGLVVFDEHVRLVTVHAVMTFVAIGEIAYTSGEERLDLRESERRERLF